MVVLKDGKIVATGAALSGGSSRAEAAEQARNEALKSAGLSLSDVRNVVATGHGKWDVKFAGDYIVEPVADAEAARSLFPTAKSVVDIGADQIRVVTLSEDGDIREVVLNQKCAAGIGTFFRTISRRLGLTLEDMSQMPGNGTAGVSVSDGCCVFAELDAINLLFNNTPKADIVGAINEAIAARINSVLNDKIVPGKDTTVLIGGVDNNPGVIKALKKRSGINFLIPERPEYAGALGAALIAAG